MNPINNRGARPNTTRGLQSGANTFKRFADGQREHNIPQKYLNEFTEEDAADRDLLYHSFACFATYLATSKDTAGNYFKPSGLVQTFSNAKNYLSKRFPTSTLLQSEHSDCKEWYIGLRVSVLYCSKCVLEAHVFSP